MFLRFYPGQDELAVRLLGHAGEGVGELSYPYELCEDRDGHIFVSEFGNSRIQVFDLQGHTIEVLGGPGAAPGFFNNPWGVALDSKGDLYVADSQNHRVQKFLRKAVVSLRDAHTMTPGDEAFRQSRGANRPADVRSPKS